MAFIDDFNKLVVKNGQQQKIANKDKAIIDLANEVANGGGGGDSFVTEIKSIYTGIPGNLEKQQITKIQHEGEEYDGFYIDTANNTDNFSILLSEKENIENEDEDVNVSIGIKSNFNDFTFSYKILGLVKSAGLVEDIYIVLDKNLEVVFVVKINKNKFE